MTRKTPEAIANLGITLANLGRIDEAQRWLKEAVLWTTPIQRRISNLGLVFDRQGLDQLAIGEYAAALSRDPGNMQARVYGAGRQDAERASGRGRTQLYREALEKTPDSTRIQTSLAMALVKARRHGEARGASWKPRSRRSLCRSRYQQCAGATALPRHPVTRSGTVRVRCNGPGAVRGHRSKPDSSARTYAMALSRDGDFAAARQAAQLEASLARCRKSGAVGGDPFAARNLARYQQRKPSREG